MTLCHVTTLARALVRMVNMLTCAPSPLRSPVNSILPPLPPSLLSSVPVGSYRYQVHCSTNLKYLRKEMTKYRLIITKVLTSELDKLQVCTVYSLCNKVYSIKRGFKLLSSNCLKSISLLRLII